MDADLVHSLIHAWVYNRSGEVAHVINKQEEAIRHGLFAHHANKLHVGTLYKHGHTYGARVAEELGGGLLPFDVRMHFTKCIAEMIAPHVRLLNVGSHQSLVCLMQMIQVYSVERREGVTRAIVPIDPALNVKFAMPWLATDNGKVEFGHAVFEVDMYRTSNSELARAFERAMVRDDAHYLIDQLYYPLPNHAILFPSNTYMQWVPVWLMPSVMPEFEYSLAQRMRLHALPGDTAVEDFLNSAQLESYLVPVHRIGGDAIAELFPWQAHFGGLMGGYKQADKLVNDTKRIQKAARQ